MVVIRVATYRAHMDGESGRAGEVAIIECDAGSAVDSEEMRRNWYWDEQDGPSGEFWLFEYEDELK